MTVRVLIIEDEKLIRWSLRQKFEAREFQVTEVETGEEAFKTLDAGSFDLVPDMRKPPTRRSRVRGVEDQRPTDLTPMRDCFLVKPS